MPPRFPAPSLYSPRLFLQRTTCNACYSRAQAARPRCSTQSRPLRRTFLSTRPLLQGAFASKNHYERLEVRHDASPVEIKKSFYKLSKAHHPDANPSDPSAAQNFSLISESYSLLSDPTRRAAYDRDVLRLHQQSSHAASPRGSYHSAGGRPASGLSKRRGTYRGPPPSFYRSGGYGSHGDKRRKAHEESTTTGGDTRHRGETFKTKEHGGMGPGDDPFGHHQDVPHFDRAGNLKTQRKEDDRRWQRAHRAVDDDNMEFEPQMSQGAHFMVVMTLILVSFVVPTVYLQFGRSSKKKSDN